MEKHYGEGEGTGTRVLNPVTEVYLGENSVFTLDTAQIKGVDSTVRENNVYLEANSKLYVIEKLMTHGNQEATSNMIDVYKRQIFSIIGSQFIFCTIQCK